MTLIEWDNNLSIGNPTIDRDHRVLIQDVNEMHSALAAGKGKQILRDILAKLVKDAQEHFGREEILWKSGGYADVDEHKQQHGALLYAGAEFQARYDKGTALLSLDVINFLVLWLMPHILESDKPAAAAIGLLEVTQSNETFDWGIIEEAGKAHGFDLVLPTQTEHRE